MIIGRGLVATAFATCWQHDATTAIVAAGVSNSAESDPAAFAREEKLLGEVISNPAIERIVYFGSCAVGNAAEQQTPYLQHKARMEALGIETDQTQLNPAWIEAVKQTPR